MKIAVLGCGNMGSALVRGCAKVFGQKNIFIFDRDSSKEKALLKELSVTKCLDMNECFQKGDLILLAVKPQDMDEVLNEVKRFLLPRKLIISIAAGITTVRIEECLGRNFAVIRVMPNLGAQIGKSVSALCRGKTANQDDLDCAVKVFQSVGETFILSESIIDTITAISGSGPGYLYEFLRVLERAAVKLGLPPALAHKIVLKTAEGAIAYASAQDSAFDALVSRVASRKGTTDAALSVFRKARLENLMLKAVQAAKRRAGQLK